MKKFLVFTFSVCFTNALLFCRNTTNESSGSPLESFTECMFRKATSLHVESLVMLTNNTNLNSQKSMSELPKEQTESGSTIVINKVVGIIFLIAMTITCISLCIILIVKRSKWTEKKQTHSNIRDVTLHSDSKETVANLSELLQTPLVMILNPLDELLKKELYDKDVTSSLLLIRKHTNRLYQLLHDPEYFLNNDLKLIKNKTTTNFGKLTNETFLLFVNYARQHYINYTINPIMENIFVELDIRMMENALFHLFTYLFQTTQDYGTIQVDVQTIGIKEINTRYPELFSEDINTQIPYIQMTFICMGTVFMTTTDLTITNQFPDQLLQKDLRYFKNTICAHNGKITVETKLNNSYQINILLPADKKSVDSGYKNRTYLKSNFQTSPKNSQRVNPRNENKNRKQLNILIVGNNHTMRKFIGEILMDDYRIHEATYTKNALEKAASINPGLIITSNQLYDCSGSEFIRQLKLGKNTFSISTLLVTNTSITNEIMTGYDSGADDYISLPFDPMLLKAKVKHLFKTKENFMEIYSKRISIKDYGIQPALDNQIFLQEIYSYLEKNIGNSAFSIDTISAEFHMSHSNFYRKVKETSGLSPTELIKRFKLEIAAKILSETNTPISEVYVTTGFSCITYFSRCFKSYFNMSPSEYSKMSKRNK